MSDLSLAIAIETGDLSALPSRRDEDWRWTDLRGLIRDMPARSPNNEGWLKPGPFGDQGDEEVLIVNGYGAADINIQPEDTEVLRLRFAATTASSSHVAHALIVVGEGAHLTLLESHEADVDGYIAHVGLDFELAEGATVERIVLVSDPADAVRVVDAYVSTAPGAKFSQTILASGARRQRIETAVTHAGQGAQVRLDGAYLLTGKAHSDQTTRVTHEAVGGQTSELVKGAVAGQARAVFQGRITVETGADQTDARMGHHALILSDKAEVDSKPELLIHADDVSCAHGNTVGALDQDALFYARQRGIPEAAAKAMLTEAFVGEVVDRIVHEGARDVARAWVAEALSGL
jgi:Fe-S cluster assembly protein SufD